MNGREHKQIERDTELEMVSREESVELCEKEVDPDKDGTRESEGELKSDGQLTGKWMGLLLLSYLAYIILGGIIFHFIESPYRKKTSIDPEQWIAKTLSNKPNLTREDLLSLAEDIIDMYDQGIVLGSNSSPNYDNSFDIGSSMFFSTTLVTTIGYGNITPMSFGGRLFAVFFASIGIPLFLVTSGEFGLKLHKLCHKISFKISKKVQKTRKYRNQMTLIIVTVSGYLIFGLAASIIFSVYEEWTYSQALYYSFITLTTIGLGDFYPVFAGGGNNSVSGIFYRLFVIIWILSGLVWMASIVSGTSQLFKKFLIASLPAKHRVGRSDSKEDKVISTEN